MPFKTPACPAMKAPVQIVMMEVVGLSVCARTKAETASEGTVVGSGPGIMRMSREPGATEELVRSAVDIRLAFAVQGMGEPGVRGLM